MQRNPQPTVESEAQSSGGGLPETKQDPSAAAETLLTFPGILNPVLFPSFDNPRDRPLMPAPRSVPAKEGKVNMHLAKEARKTRNVRLARPPSRSA